MTIGEKIKRLRKERNMTQEELGEAIGVQKAAVNKYETGIVVNLKREIIAKIARVFEVNPVWLMDDQDGWPPVPSARKLIARAAKEDAAAAREKVPRTVEARILAKGIDQLPKAQREQALNVIRAMFSMHSDYFTKGTDDDDT